MTRFKFITAALLVTLLSIPSAVFALKKGEPFPALSGTTLAGESFNFNSIKGQPILLKVGTTWCPTCSQQSKEINDLHGFLVENKIKFVEVFIQESPKTVIKMFSKNGHHSPDVIIMDKGKIASKLNIYLIPRIILIDRDFNIYRDGDPLPSAALKQELQKMLTGE
ncbi:MAG: TlpA family protein disulfide reductase [Desulfuromusa sp.]|nr:TlpA family protein disulfide reductase [Desulfuromusa sp.]